MVNEEAWSRLATLVVPIPAAAFVAGLWRSSHAPARVPLCPVVRSENKAQGLAAYLIMCPHPLGEELE